MKNYKLNLNLMHNYQQQKLPILVSKQASLLYLKIREKLKMAANFSLERLFVKVEG